MKRTQFPHFLLILVFWVPVAYLSFLLAHNAILYFTHGGEYGILPEKWAARQDMLWNTCFYIHLPTGVLCLLSPLFLFARRYIKKGLSLHQFIGRLYVWITLVLVCPTGMYLAFYAKGGTVTQVGFLIQGLLLAAFTYQGYLAICRGDKRAHVRYMTRSYAMVLVVITFRVLHIVFFMWKVPYQDNYAMSQWLGLSLNALLAEIVLVRFSISHTSNPISV